MRPQTQGWADVSQSHRADHRRLPSRVLTAIPVTAATTGQPPAAPYGGRGGPTPAVPGAAEGKAKLITALLPCFSRTREIATESESPV